MSNGPFHRKESPTQTSALAVIQVQTSEIWGLTPQGGMEPTVQAYAGPIGAVRGIEFHTPISPYPSGSPLEARWYLTLTPGVQKRVKNGEDYACVIATVTNCQP